MSIFGFLNTPPIMQSETGFSQAILIDDQSLNNNKNPEEAVPFQPTPITTNPTLSPTNFVPSTEEPQTLPTMIQFIPETTTTPTGLSHLYNENDVNQPKMNTYFGRQIESEETSNQLPNQSNSLQSSIINPPTAINSSNAEEIKTIITKTETDQQEFIQFYYSVGDQNGQKFSLFPQQSQEKVESLNLSDPVQARTISSDQQSTLEAKNNPVIPKESANKSIQNSSNIQNINNIGALNNGTLNYFKDFPEEIKSLKEFHLSKYPKPDLSQFKQFVASVSQNMNFCSTEIQFYQRILLKRGFLTMPNPIREQTFQNLQPKEEVFKINIPLPPKPAPLFADLLATIHQFNDSIISQSNNKQLESIDPFVHHQTFQFPPPKGKNHHTAANPSSQSQGQFGQIANFSTNHLGNNFMLNLILENTNQKNKNQIPPANNKHSKSDFDEEIQKDSQTSLFIISEKDNIFQQYMYQIKQPFVCGMVQNEAIPFQTEQYPLNPSPSFLSDLYSFYKPCSKKYNTL